MLSLTLLKKPSTYGDVYLKDVIPYIDSSKCREYDSITRVTYAIVILDNSHRNIHRILIQRYVDLWYNAAYQTNRVVNRYC